MEKLDSNLENALSIAAIVPKAYKTETCDVVFDGGLAEAFSKAYTNAVNSRLDVKASNAEKFSLEELHNYFNTLLSFRIKSCRYELKGEMSWAKNLYVPALFAQMLLKVGVVFGSADKSEKKGITLNPQMDPKVKVLSREEMFRISEKLSDIQAFGFEMVMGLPRDINGDIEFMFFELENDVVVRHNASAHPALALFAAYFRMRRSLDILGNRVSYGSIDVLQEAMGSLIRSEGQ